MTKIDWDVATRILNAASGLAADAASPFLKVGFVLCVFLPSYILSYALVFVQNKNDMVPNDDDNMPMRLSSFLLKTKTTWARMMTAKCK